MQLEKFHYTEPSSNTTNEWSVNDVSLQDLNLFVGLNASGKTRLVNTIQNLARVLKGAKRIKNGHWFISFKLADKSNLSYELELVEGEILKEIIKQDKSIKLSRERDEATVWSEAQNKNIPINPPVDSVTLLARRDKNEHPFLELLHEWAMSTSGYRVTAVQPDNFAIGKIDMDQPLENLELSTDLFDNFDQKSQSSVIKDFNYLGYNIENIVGEQPKNIPILKKILSFKEKGLKKPILQHSLSVGMYRAFVIVLIIHHIGKIAEKSNRRHTLIIDDFTEGMDHVRSRKLAELITNSCEKFNIQFILTSNSRVFMDGIDIQFWNILTREGGKVNALNYTNSKSKFDEFKLTGLSNFALFSSDYLNE